MKGASERGAVDGVPYVVWRGKRNIVYIGVNGKRRSMRWLNKMKKAGKVVVHEALYAGWSPEERALVEEPLAAAIVARLEDLAALRDGWIDDDDESQPPTKALCRWVDRELRQAIEAKGWDRPLLFATRLGGVDAVWRFPMSTLRASFSSRPLEVRLSVVNLKSKTSSKSDASRSLAPLLSWADRALEGVI